MKTDNPGESATEFIKSLEDETFITKFLYESITII